MIIDCSIDLLMDLTELFALGSCKCASDLILTYFRITFLKTVFVETLNMDL